MPPSRTMKPRHHRMDDERLARLAGAGDVAAFEALYDRHHAPLLAFCRHMLGSREDGEDALQQAFVRAHKALAGGRAPDRVRPWLYAIARNRCLTLIAARREAAVPADDLEPSFDGLAAEVERRADLRELVADLGRLPDDQRAALVLAELGDLGHGEIARVIGCPPAKVKALVFQARTALIAERDARRTPCDEIRAQLETARAGVLRRGALRRHLRQCDPCAAYRVAVEGQRTGLAILLPVAPSAGLKLAVLAGAGGLGGGAEAAAAAASLAAGGAAAGGGGAGVAGSAGAGVAGSAGAGVAGSAGAGVAGSAGAAGVAASAGAVKALAVKAVVVAALAAGGGEAVREIAHEEPAASAASAQVEPAVERAAVRSGAPAPAPAPPSATIAEPGDAAAIAGGEPGTADDESGAVSEASSPVGDDPPASAGRRARRVLAAAAAGDPRAVRRVRHRLRAADPAVARRVRRRLIRARLRAGLAPTVGVVLATRRERRRDRIAGEPELVPEPVGTTEPVATATPEPRPRRRRRPRPVPTPVPVPAPTAEPAPAVAAEPVEEPAPAPEPEPVDESDATDQPG